MPAYFVYVCQQVLDRAKLETYWREIIPTLEGYDAKSLSSYAPFEQLEGDPVEAVVVVEFPSRERAREWYDSDAYKRIRHLRIDPRASRRLTRMSHQAALFRPSWKPSVLAPFRSCFEFTSDLSDVAALKARARKFVLRRHAAAVRFSDRRCAVRRTAANLIHCALPLK